MAVTKDSSAYPEFSHPGIGGYPDRGTQTGEPVVGRVPPTHDAPESPDPVLSGGVAQDAEGTDTVAGGGAPAPYDLVGIGQIMTPASSVTVMGNSVAQSVSNAQARYRSHEAETHPQGSQIGTPMNLPPVVSDWSKHAGGSDATAY